MPPRLPAELLLLIIEIAVTHDQKTAVALCLVSKWIKAQVEPILYRVISLRSLPKGKSYTLLSSSKLNTYTRCLGFVTNPITEPLSAFPDLHSNLKISNFATDEVSPQTMRHCICVQELHFFGWTGINPEFVPHELKRVHALVTHRNLSDLTLILGRSHLTHVALSLTIENGLLRHGALAFALAVSRILSHQTIVILFVRLMKRGPVFQRIEGYLASIKDRRLVVKRMEIHPGDGKEALLAEWEQGASKGWSIWDMAEAEKSLSPVVASA